MNKTPQFSTAALENIAETGADWKNDLLDLQTELVTSEQLLEECMVGADDDREQGWRDYVSALVSHMEEAGK